MKTLYLMGGPMGVGKTTVCQELKKLLPDCVFLDGDWCWDATPFQVTEETKKMVMDNICHVLNNFLHCSAYQSVIFCWVMDQQEILDKLRNRLDINGCQVFSLSLICNEETLSKRLEKDILAGKRARDVIKRSMERLPRYESVKTQKLDTTGKVPSQVVEEICALTEKREPIQ